MGSDVVSFLGHLQRDDWILQLGLGTRILQMGLRLARA